MQKYYAVTKKLFNSKKFKLFLINLKKLNKNDFNYNILRFDTKF